MERFEKYLERVVLVEEEKSVQDLVKKQKMEEPDLPPEFCHYRDEGCELAKSCLRCPFPKCVYDLPWGRLKCIKSLRDKEIARLHIEEKISITELVDRFNVSLRTVYRAVASGRNKKKKVRAVKN
jgi:hypothetical protein